MKLAELLGIERGITALIGGGGKTTLLYHLAEELRSHGTVLVATTTKIWPPTHLQVVQSREDLQKALCCEGIACAGIPTTQGKLTEPSFPWMDAADYVLVEADGAAGRPCKAHETWEPVLPQECDNVVLVLGADGFGKPIVQAAHRPALYARLSGTDQESLITPEIAARVINREGLHDRVFLNQIDTATQWPLARQFAAQLVCPVVAGTLRGQYWEQIK